MANLAVLRAETRILRNGFLTSEETPRLPLKGWVYLWTFTLPDSEATLSALSERWRNWARNWRRDIPYWRGVRVFERSPVLRWHAHVVGVERFCVMTIRGHAQKYGFGRVHVKRIPAMKAGYVAKYLVKMRRLEETNNVRLAAAFGFKGISGSDIEVEDTWTDYICKHSPTAPNMFVPFYQRRETALKYWLASTRPK